MDLFQADAGQTPILPEEARGLRISILTRAQLNDAESQNILLARRWAMRPATWQRHQILSDEFGRLLHRRMFSRVWSWAGRYRTSPRNIGMEAHQITEAVHNALADAAAQLEFGTYPVDEVAVRLHHRLAVIHPWTNGNGRHARLLADVVIASRGSPALTWSGAANLTHPSERRRAYLDAVRRADQQDFLPLLQFARGA
jgi:Fic-DOC domain mobile mystery protein B